MSIRLVLAATVMLSVVSMHTAEAKGFHVVTQGETLWKISRIYGCQIQAIQAQNQLNNTTLQIGQTIKIPQCEKKRAQPGSASTTLYTVKAGDTLGSIAEANRRTVEELQIANTLGGGVRIFPGDSIRIPATTSNRRIPVTFKIGQSVGTTNHGRLRRPSRLRAGKGYFIRRPHRSFGAQQTVLHTKRIATSIKKRFPKVHPLAVGDISEKAGGKISMHASHQSGRDIDLGFYFKRRPQGYPHTFVVATRKNLHFAATWALLKGFTDLANKPGGVEKIFMSYSTQRIIYNMAKRKGVSKAKLDSMFQYPHGRSSSKGIIRHEPGHDEHIHVRFRCPPKDSTCE